MKLVFLGTSAGTPTRARNMSSLALQWTQEGELWLFDCGEGTQHQILRAPVRVGQLSHVFVTHLHGDHVFGLPGLLASRSLIKGLLTPVTLHGPEGLSEFLRATLSITQTNVRFPIDVQGLTEGVIYEDETRMVTCRLLSHGIPSHGFAIEEKPRPGEFDAERAAQLGVPFGPLYGRLKRGESVTLDDGRVIDGTELVGPPKPGRKIVICGDTGATPATVELAQGADVLVHEATFREDNAERARQVGHSTASGAATAAREAGVGTLILTHFSPRYESAGEGGLTPLLDEARAIFPNTYLAHDFWTFDVPQRERGAPDPESETDKTIA